MFYEIISKLLFSDYNMLIVCMKENVHSSNW